MFSATSFTLHSKGVVSRLGLTLSNSVVKFRLDTTGLLKVVVDSDKLTHVRSV